RQAELEARAEAYDPDAMSVAGVVVTVAQDGSVRVERGLVRAEDRKAAKALERRLAGDEGPSPAKGARPKGLSDKLVEDLTTHRTAALRACLIERPDVALIALVHSLAVQVVYGAGSDRPSALEIGIDRQAI